MVLGKRQILRRNKQGKSPRSDARRGLGYGGNYGYRCNRTLIFVTKGAWMYPGTISCNRIGVNVPQGILAILGVTIRLIGIRRTVAVTNLLQHQLFYYTQQ